MDSHSWKLECYFSKDIMEKSKCRSNKYQGSFLSELPCKEGDKNGMLVVLNREIIK